MKYLLYKILNRVVVEYLSLKSKKIIYLEVGRPKLPSWASRVAKYSESVEIATSGALTEISVHHYFQQRWIYELRNVRLEPRRGDIFTDRGELIVETTNWHPYFPNPLRHWRKNSKSLPVVEQPYLFLASWAYFHFLIENLPSFLATKMQYPLSPVIISQNSPSYLYEILEMLEISAISVSSQVTVPNLAVCSKGRDSGWAHPSDTSLLRETFKNYLKSREIGKAVYISRTNSTRSPNNENALIESLSAIGVQIVFSESLKISEQISLFSSADLLIGIHGAGLANQVWMEEGSNVIEIIDQSYFNICFEALARAMGHNYHGIIYDSREANYSLPLDIIIQKIRNIEIN